MRKQKTGGRPGKGPDKLVLLQTFVSPWALAELKKIAADESCSVSLLVRQAIARLLQERETRREVEADPQVQKIVARYLKAVAKERR